jgi:hypothetical protein
LADLINCAAGKYKEYNKLRDISSGKTVVEKGKVTKRKSGDDVPLTPSKRARSVDATPRKCKDSRTEVPEAHVEHETPVAKRTMMGPTPQKDGQVLGIFDLLPSETPSRLRTVLGNIANIMRTPSKPNVLFKDDATMEANARGSKTPQSTGKRFLLDSFVTPRKRKSEEEEGTPSSSMKRLKTPSFLKRDNFVLDTVTEEPLSPKVALPWKRSFGRSLSGMIKDLRKQEDEEGDDEWEAMREMEEDMVSSKPTTLNIPKIVVQDSQRDVVLDAEGFVPSDAEETDSAVLPQLDRNGNPRKPYKKKGLKRQTRRVISKYLGVYHFTIQATNHPVRPVSLKAPEAEKSVDQSDNENEPVECIAESQAVIESNESTLNIDNEAARSHSEDAFDPDELPDKLTVPTSSNPSKTGNKKSSKVADLPEKKPNKKKGKPEAHANYVKLKIKNQNTKAKTKGRFNRNKR